MDAFKDNPPPALADFPPAWYAKVIELAARGPATAASLAKTLEEAFAIEVPGPKERDARRLINWLRSFC